MRGMAKEAVRNNTGIGNHLKIGGNLYGTTVDGEVSVQTVAASRICRWLRSSAAFL